MADNTKVIIHWAVWTKKCIVDLTPPPVTIPAWIYWNETDWLITLADWTWNQITIADKNLWATAVWWYWKFFQWWNNSDAVISWSTSWTAVDASTYWPSNYYNSNTFITANPWDNSWNSDLRWDFTNTNEARRWPCDEWWHVPSKAEADILRNTMIAWWFTTKSQFSQYLKLTLDWYYDTNRWVHGVWSKVMYWTSTRNWDNAYEIYMYWNDPLVTSEWISQWLVIRPFKNNVVAPDGTWTILYQPS